jgi:uncharacterized membrane protein
MPEPEPPPQLDDAEERWSRERHEQPIWWWASLIGPPLSGLLFLSFLALYYDLEYARAVAVRALLSFVFFGRVVILEPTVELSAEALLVMVVFMDVAAAIFSASHVTFLFRVPWIGRRLRTVAEDGETLVTKNPWTGHLTFLGLVLFVLIPIASTGSLGGGILGRILGLSRGATILGVILGSLLCSGLFYSASSWVRANISPDSTLWRVLGVAAVVGIVWLLNRRYHQAAHKARGG